MKLVGTLHDKQLYVYDPNIKCSEDDFKQFVSQFSRIETLRQICSISSQLFLEGKSIYKIGEVPVREDLLYDFAYRIIKHCDDKTERQMNDGEVELAFKMCYVLNDAELITKKRRNAFEILTMISYRQFHYQQHNYNNFARNYYIYTNLWYRLPISQSIDILSEVKSEIGMPYEYAILFAYALAGNKNGHFWIYDEKIIEELKNSTGLNLSVDDHSKFVDWCSGDYDGILNQNNQLPPFVRYPIIETKSKPVENNDEVFLIASQQLLHDKLTSGLYFYLMDRFNKGKGKNKFKEIFGLVFQEYVGEILRYYFTAWEIIPEIKYKKMKKNTQDSVDWFLIKDDKLIMIEVKQSSIFINSKYNPSIGGIKSDLRQTVMHGVKQLKTSERDIKSKKYQKLHRFRNVKSFMKLIVVNDPLFNANYIVKNLFKDEISDLSFQIININDFETLLSSQSASESLFDILDYKTLNYNEMDFNEYIYRMFPDAKSNIEFLEPIFEGFFRKIKVEE